jgi:hypothetical protein
MRGVVWTWRLSGLECGRSVERLNLDTLTSIRLWGGWVCGLADVCVCV